MLNIEALGPLLAALLATDAPKRPVMLRPRPPCLGQLYERRKGEKGAPKGNQNAGKQSPQNGDIKGRVVDQIAAAT